MFSCKYILRLHEYRVSAVKMKQARFIPFVILCLLCVGLVSAYSREWNEDFDYTRARLLGAILSQELETYHFSRKKIDDNLSRAALGLYLKQLDPQKRFLLQDDVDHLDTFSDKIDDELKSGTIRLPLEAEGILSERQMWAHIIIREILSRNFDFTSNETVETDADKLAYCRTLDDLRERWRKILKYQALGRYLNLLEVAESGDNSTPGRSKYPAGVQEQAREKILKAYNELFIKIKQEKKSEQYDRYFNSVLRAFDPHTDYMPPMNKEDFDINMKGSLEGIGAVLREEDGYVKVESIVPGGPAARQGKLLAGDIILKVGEGDVEPVDITDMRLRDAVSLIRGKKGTEVRLTVMRKGGGRTVISIIRDVVQLEDFFAKGITIRDEMSGRTFGYIKLPGFYRDFRKSGSEQARNATEDVKNELNRLVADNISGLIFDVRNNGGGALTDAVDIAGFFIKTGPVVQIKNSSGQISILEDNDPGISYSGPMAVLVNKFSASASEILAGALQDYGRAVIIGGEHTHGKGTVQAMADLDTVVLAGNMARFKPLGAMKLTTQKFYRVSGGSTQYKGVVPDIVLPDKLEGLKSGEKDLKYALPWDTVNPVPYQRWSLSTQDISDLRAKSAARVKNSPEFSEMKKEGESISALQKDTIKSLNIASAREERKELSELKLREDALHGKIGHGKAKQGSAKDREEQWESGVKSDPYVRESMSVLKDLLRLNPGPSMN